MTNVRQLEVNVPGGPYSVWIGDGILDAPSVYVPVPPSAQMCALVCDASVLGLHGARVRDGLSGLGLRIEEFAVPPGEATKNVATAESLWRWLAGVGAHRRDLVVALGGGVVGDLAGFVAATFHRGLAIVQMPTTLLAMVDAAIGGKTAVDLPEGKNLVGAFHHPRAVLADVSTLSTLPDPHLRTGVAEVIKHGLIAEGDLLGRVLGSSDLILGRDPDALVALVAEAAVVKIGVVERDDTELGERAHLNYGHTLGHALEALGNYGRWTHGEAVAIGMMFAAHLAAELGYADRVALHRRALEMYGLPTDGTGFGFDEVAALWARDKKYEKGMRFVVLEDLGRPAVVADVPEAALRKAYEAVR